MKRTITGFLRRQRGLLLFIAALALFRSAVADWNDVPTGSMLPTIVEGDRVYVDKLAYDLRLPFTRLSLHAIAQPARGDIVVFESARAGKRLIKRVVGLPGDVIAMRDDVLFINGRAVTYARDGADPELWREALAGHPHAVRLSTQPSSFDDFGPVRVPDAHLLVLGDNRDRSADSRVFGFVPRDEVVGRAERIVFSLDYDRYLMPRGDRFLRPLD